MSDVHLDEFVLDAVTQLGNVGVYHTMCRRTFRPDVTQVNARGWSSVSVINELCYQHAQICPEVSDD